ncbi:BlaI/MecI/CopY family transcriptional regulator [Bacteroidota bacterium]
MKIKPTDSELQVLQILWRDGPSTVRHINDVLNLEKRVGYTTTLKIMQIMNEKFLLKREKNGRNHVYLAAVKKEETQKILLDRFLNSTFSGSAGKLVMQALGNHKSSKEELEKIKDLITKIEGETK